MRAGTVVDQLMRATMMRVNYFQCKLFRNSQNQATGAGNPYHSTILRSLLDVDRPREYSEKNRSKMSKATKNEITSENLQIASANPKSHQSIYEREGEMN